MQAYPTQLVDVDQLKDHPRNYRRHPEEQLEEIMTSIRDHGLYRNVVTARDLTILAGHGVVEACRRLEIPQINVVVLDLDPGDDRALKLIIADNDLSLGADDDDFAKVEILEQLLRSGVGIEGTGWNPQGLTAFKTIIAPPDQLHRENTMAEWEAAGLPLYEPGTEYISLMVHFDNPEDRERFIKEHGFGEGLKREGRTWSTKWPPRPFKDLKSVMVEG